MRVDLDLLTTGREYSREQLTELWHLGGPQALRRGMVTPRESPNVILLFITEEKDGNQPLYRDRLVANELIMESDGEEHNERRLSALNTSDDVAYLFYRKRSYSPFTYYGPLVLRQVLPPTSEGRLQYRFTLGDAAGQLVTADETDQAIAAELRADEEGRPSASTTTSYSRSRTNRQLAIDHHGSSCVVCGFSFDDRYGADLADGYIQVHHLVPVPSSVRTPDPVKEMVPVCPNCHAMLHRRRDRLVSIAELSARVRDRLV